MGLLEGQRGRGGGGRLARPADEIKLGELMGPGEGEAGMIDCPNSVGGPSRIVPVCRLKGIYAEAHQAFLTVLNEHTLKDLVGEPKMQKALLKLLNAED